MEHTIQVIEKPDWISWEDIKLCLMEAHASNREKGIVMSHYQWPAAKIRASIGDNGVILVAVEGEKVVGTAAIIEKEGHSWYAKGKYAYLGFAGVLPEFNGKGIYKELTNRRERIAFDRGYSLLVFDTHSNNTRVQDIAIKNGYQKVDCFRARSGDHYSVVMAKWLTRCPYSKFYCGLRYRFSKVKSVLRTLLLSNGK